MESARAWQRRRECAAARLSKMVDDALNSDAIAEARDATSATVPIGDQPEDYKVYNDSGEVRFNPWTIRCNLCLGGVALIEYGAVDAPFCETTGSCELIWAQCHPEDYKNDDGKLSVRQLPCKGDSCQAVIGLRLARNGDLTASIRKGSCLIEENGSQAQLAAGINALENSTPETFGGGFEPFDGQE